MSNPFTSSEKVLRDLKLHHASLLDKHQIIETDKDKIVGMAKRYGSNYFKDAYETISTTQSELIGKIERVEIQIKKMEQCEREGVKLLNRLNEFETEVRL